MESLINYINKFNLSNKDINTVVNCLNDCIYTEDLLNMDIVRELESFSNNISNVKFEKNYYKHICDMYYESGLSFPINKKNYGAERKACIVLGLPASGKSTFVSKYVKENNAVEFDSDVVKKLMVEYYDNGKGNELCHKVSKKIMEDFLLERLANDGYNLTIQVVGKKLKSVRKLYKILVHNNYSIELVLVKLPIEKVMKRNLFRFLDTGRYVSFSYINKINPNNIEKVFNEVKTWGSVRKYSIYDNDVMLGEDAIVVSSTNKDDIKNNIERSNDMNYFVCSLCNVCFIDCVRFMFFKLKRYCSYIRNCVCMDSKLKFNYGVIRRI